MSLSAVTMTTSNPDSAPASERPDDVVGLVPGHLEDRDPVGRAGAADVGDLDAQILLHGGAVGLVPVVLVVPDGPLGPVEGHGEILGRMLAEHLLEHRHEPVDRVGRLAFPGRQSPDRVVSAVDVGHGIHQIERRARFGHGSRILWRAGRAAWGPTKRHFGAPFLRIGIVRRRAKALAGFPEVEFGQEVAAGKRRAKKQNARPVAGVARFNVPILVNAHQSVNENRLENPKRLNRVPGER